MKYLFHLATVASLNQKLIQNISIPTVQATQGKVGTMSTATQPATMTATPMVQFQATNHTANISTQQLTATPAPSQQQTQTQQQQKTPTTSILIRQQAPQTSQHLQQIQQVGVVSGQVTANQTIESLIKNQQQQQMQQPSVMKNNESQNQPQQSIQAQSVMPTITKINTPSTGSVNSTTTTSTPTTFTTLIKPIGRQTQQKQGNLFI